MTEEKEEKEGLKAVADRVRTNGKVLTVPTGELRDAFGAKRLGKIVSDRIRDELSSMGIGMIPMESKDSKEPGDSDWNRRESVRLYVLGSEVDHLIQAVNTPGELGDEKIRDAVGGRATEILNEIRILVCE